MAPIIENHFIHIKPKDCSYINLDISYFVNRTIKLGKAGCRRLTRCYSHRLLGVLHRVIGISILEIIYPVQLAPPFGHLCLPYFWDILFVFRILQRFIEHKKSRQVGTAALYIKGWGGPRTRIPLTLTFGENFKMCSDVKNVGNTGKVINGEEEKKNKLKLMHKAPRGSLSSALNGRCYRQDLTCILIT
ncbi:hypothetical protein AGLY_005674 [Aphis glycines]|uniref:Uncharacterized protein n=1 Tax=Aphis glycines TaxID=307491 RepID=A0A6G0TTL5_APHGL|nr:hypothetical protein AGLY_005674 [Aphis glycines]